MMKNGMLMYDEKKSEAENGTKVVHPEKLLHGVSQVKSLK